MRKRDIGKLVPRRLMIRELAEIIAKELFTGGKGEVADYVKLFRNDRYLGSWAYRSVIDRIEEVLARNTDRENSA